MIRTFTRLEAVKSTFIGRTGRHEFEEDRERNGSESGDRERSFRSAGRDRLYGDGRRSGSLLVAWAAYLYRQGRGQGVLYRSLVCALAGSADSHAALAGRGPSCRFCAGNAWTWRSSL